MRAGHAIRASADAGVLAGTPFEFFRIAVYRIRVCHGRRNEPKGLREAHYIGLLSAVHAQPHPQLS
jgi:hypothetical protein